MKSKHLKSSGSDWIGHCIGKKSINEFYFMNQKDHFFTLVNVPAYFLLYNGKISNV